MILFPTGHIIRRCLTHLAILTSGLILSFGAHASSPIAFVGGATVNQGQGSVEWRTGFVQDSESASRDSRLQMRQHLDYGLTDWYALRLIVAQDKRAGEHLEHQGVTIENRFQLIERRDYGWDGGLRLQYTQNDGDKSPNEIDFRIMAQVPLSETWEWRHNTVIEHEVGANSRSGLQLEFRNKISTSIDPFLPHMTTACVGLTMFNDFGRLRDTSGYTSQDHQIGPIIGGSFENGMFFDTGYRKGISRGGTDHLYKFFVGYQF